MKRSKKAVLGNRASAPETWDLLLYVYNKTPKSVLTLNNLETICEEHLAGRYTLEVIDLKQQPQLAKANDIVAVPTLIKRLPVPEKIMIGDFSDRKRALTALGLEPTA